MREAVGPSPTFFGSVDNGPVGHYLFWDSGYDAKFCGPFDDEEKFNSALAGLDKRKQEENKKPLFRHQFYSSHLGDVLNGHKSTFTHGDVQRKNIIVIDQAQDTPQRLRSHRVGLVDWEAAGWYPDYWEYFAAYVAFRRNEDWSAKREDFIDAHAAGTAMIGYDIWGNYLFFWKAFYRSIFMLKQAK